MNGHVYLVGAGPGDPKLITIRGKEAIEKADVIVYDRLASPHLLKWARPEAERIYVGKLPDRHTLKQHEINQLLVDHAMRGRIVTRLKGGDPSIFGRVGEEAETLVHAGIPFDLVPGVTSSIAVPLYAGIPVTHRDFTSSLAIVTGHECPKKNDSSLDWERLAQATGTMVFLMGVKNIRYLVEQLLTNGRDQDTPVAVIQWGTTSKQRTVTGTLISIEAAVIAAQLTSPAVIVLGDVVNLRKQLNWFETKPLFGRRIVVTRARAQASELVERIEALGGEAVELPVIEVTSSLAKAELPDPEHWDWIVFTSKNAVEHFFAALKKTDVDSRRFYRAQIAVIGQATAHALSEHGWKAVVCPSQQDREGLWEILKGRIHSGQHVLLPRGQLAGVWLPSQLRSNGADVHEWTVYETSPLTDPDSFQELVHQLRAGELDAVTFTSSSTVQSFCGQLQRIGDVQALLQGIPLICIGTQTAETARGFSLDQIITSDTSDLDGMVLRLLEAFVTKME